MIEGAREQQDRAVGGMSTRAAWVLPWSIWILCLALVALTGLFPYLTPTLPGRFEGLVVPESGVFPAMIMAGIPDSRRSDRFAAALGTPSAGSCALLGWW